MADDLIARAWQVFEHGEPSSVLRLGDVNLAHVRLDANVAISGHDPWADQPVPELVLVEVDACALNFADRLLCTGEYQEHPPLPFTPGLEAAGWRSDTGARVLCSPALPAGGLATYCLAAPTDLFPLPTELPSATAAAMHVTYQTGWFALHRRAALQSGETLLVHAGAGGVGSAAIQLGKAAGAIVLATAGSPEKVALCRSLGADGAFNYRTTDIASTVLDLTDGRGADVVFDSVGGATFEASTKCIAWEGRILVIGAASGRYSPARTNHAMVKNYSVVGVHWGGYRTRRPDLVAAAHEAIMLLWLDGAITPLVSETVGMADVPAALDRLGAGATTGKIVVRPHT